jgi:hypothetical protein
MLRRAWKVSHRPPHSRRSLEEDVRSIARSGQRAGDKFDVADELSMTHQLRPKGCAKREVGMAEPLTAAPARRRPWIASRPVAERAGGCARSRRQIPVMSAMRYSSVYTPSTSIEPRRVPSISNPHLR